MKPCLIASQKLKRVRKKSGLQVDDICIQLKIPYNDYMELEHGENETLSKNDIEKLCKILKCRDTDILKG